MDRPAHAELRDALDEHPIIASVKDDADVDAVLDSPCRTIFLLHGTPLTVVDTITRLTDAGRRVLVDIDLLDGFEAKRVVVSFLERHTSLSGVLSTKPHLVRAAHEHGLIGVQRTFLIDSRSYAAAPRQLRSSGADCVEVLPGCIPRVIGWLAAEVDVPIIAGGLVCDREDVMAALAAGASAVASSNREVWTM